RSRRGRSGGPGALQIKVGQLDQPVPDLVDHQNQDSPHPYLPGREMRTEPRRHAATMQDPARGSKLQTAPSAITEQWGRRPSARRRRTAPTSTVQTPRSNITKTTMRAGAGRLPMGTGRGRISNEAWRALQAATPSRFPPPSGTRAAKGDRQSARPYTSSPIQ